MKSCKSRKLNVKMNARYLENIDPSFGPKEYSADETGAGALAELVGLATRLTAAQCQPDLLAAYVAGLHDIWQGAGIRLCLLDHQSGMLIPKFSNLAEPIPIMGSFLGRVVSESAIIVSHDLDKENIYLRGREAPPGLIWKKAIAGAIPVAESPGYVVGIFLKEDYEVAEKDILNLQKSIEIVHQLIDRWDSQDIRLNAFREITIAISAAIDSRDPYMIGHGERVSEFATAISRTHGLSETFTERLGIAALLHDVGRLGIPETILFKTGRLTDEEMEIVKAHPDMSASFIRRIEYLKDLVPVIRHHHERFDGSGYPDGLEGELIPLGSRILAVADAFDAMTSPRPFRGPMSDMDALDELRRESGGQFDPVIVEEMERAYLDRLIISQNVFSASDPLQGYR
ncbi:MAG TPA: HD-GYP domain-containing protein [bacterium]|jgi:HD-GYP domain-containing protein (c-di-GMP phosphodiesterase class II)